VTGPENRVTSLDGVQTDSIDLGKTISNAEFRVAGYVPDPQVRFEAVPPAITVRVSIVKNPQ
jgi:hypothetical protein